MKIMFASAIKINNAVINFDPNDLDKDLKKQLSAIDGMTPIGTRYLINKLVSIMDENNLYLEIGTHKGSSLYSAAFNNPNRDCIGVDPFSFDYENKNLGKSIESILKENIAFLKNASYIKMDGFEYLKSKKNDSEQNVQIYYYDGPHDYEPTYYGILMAMPLLTDRAVILIDDTDHPKVKVPMLAIQDVCKVYNKNFRIIRNFPSSKNISNGLVALEYVRN